jgi:hypothetical protein
MDTLDKLYNERDHFGLVMDDFVYERLFDDTNQAPSVIVNGASCVYYRSKYECRLPFNW